MKWTTAKTSDVGQKINLTYDTEEVSSMYQQVSKNIQANFSLPGFRRGKVPIEKVQEVMGEKIQVQVQELVAQRIENEILPTVELRPVNRPQIRVISLEPEKKAVFEVEYEHWPMIKMLELETLIVEEDDCTISKKDVEQFMDTARKKKAAWKDRANEPPERSATQMGDLMHISIRMQEVGKPEEKPLLEQESFYLELGKTQILPGMTEELVGIKPKEKKKFVLEIPSDLSDERFAGKKIEIVVTLQKSESPVLPEWTDNLAQALDPRSGTIADFKANVKQHLENHGNARLRQKTVQNVLQKMLEKVSFSLPPSMVEYSCCRHLSLIFSKLNIPQEVNPDTFQDAAAKLGDLLKKDVASVVADVKIGAEKALREEMLVQELDRLWKIDVPSEEIMKHMERNEQLTKGVEQKKMDTDKDREIQRRNVRENIRTDKLLDKLYQSVQVKKTGKSISFQDLVAVP